MATVNIPRDVTDPFYRYKMEKLQSKIEGKGNGIKTVVVNLPSVAGSLSRPPAYVAKFFGFELGAQTNGGDNDRWIINGAHEATKLQTHLDSFITKFVLCGACRNPETDLNIKSAQIYRSCKACGERTPVELRHKLSGYMMKNPPKKEKKAKVDKKKTSKQEKDASTVEGEAQNNGNGHVEHATSNLDQYAGDAGSDDEFTRRIQADAKNLSAEAGSTDQKDDWSVDVSEEAVKARAKDLSADLKKTLVLEGDEEEVESGGGPYEAFATWYETENRGDLEVDDIEIYKKLQELGIEKHYKTPQVLAQCLFDEDAAEQIGDRAGLLKKLIGDDSRHERAFLGGIERLVGVAHPKLLNVKDIAAILNAVSSEEIVSDEAIFKWGGKPSKRYVDIAISKKVKKAAEPFLKWLQENQSDEDEDDEEEEDDE